MKRTLRPSDVRPDPRRDVASELRFHLDMRTQEFMERGMSPDEARRAAAASFGDVAAIEAECRELRVQRARERRRRAWRWDVATDVRYGLRTLARSPLFAAAAVLTLALGIGAAAAVFTLVNGVLLRPLPYADPARLVMVWTAGDGARGRETQWPISVPNYVDLKAQSRSLASVAAFRFWPYTLAGDGVAEPEMLSGSRADPDLFATLGVRPLLGRGFTADDARPGGPRVAVIGHDLWQRRFGGAPDVLGRQVTLSGERFTIVGVMPPHFAFPRGAELPPGLQFRPRTELWTPLVFTERELQRRGVNNLAAVARLRPGVTAPQANADLSRIARHFAAEFPLYFSKDMDLHAVSLKEQAAAPVRRGLWLLMGAVGLVLLISCANVANLLAAQAAGREREFAIRTALGATRRRVFLQLVTENVILTSAGAALALGAAWATRLVLARTHGDLPRVDDVAVDVRVVAVTLAAALAAGVAFAAATALQLGAQAGAGGPGTRATAGPGRRFGRRLLVAAEVALSLVLLVGAGLLTRSFVELQRVEPGFRADGVMSAGLLMPIGSTYDPARDGAHWADFFTSYAQRLGALPGVEAAGGVSSLPLTGAVETASFGVDGQEAARGTPGAGGRPQTGEADYAVVAGDYFRAMGVPLVAGRMFDSRDRDGATPVLVVSAAFVRRAWPGVSAAEALGRRIWLGSTAEVPHTIVGVVGDVRLTALDAATVPAMYMPVAQYPYPFLTFVARTRGASAATVLPQMRAALTALDPSMALHDVRPLGAVVDASLARQRFATTLAASFAAAALVLAAVGLYGVIATSVAQRTRELGVRLALGATPRSVLALVLRDGMRTTAAGVAAGLLGALAAARLLRSQLFGVSATDPAVYVAVAVLTAAVALAATYVPARRATRLDPAVTLRGD